MQTVYRLLVRPHPTSSYSAIERLGDDWLAASTC